MTDAGHAACVMVFGVEPGSMTENQAFSSDFQSDHNAAEGGMSHAKMLRMATAPLS